LKFSLVHAGIKIDDDDDDDIIKIIRALKYGLYKERILYTVYLFILYNTYMYVCVCARARARARRGTSSNRSVEVLQEQQLADCCYTSLQNE